MSSAYVSICMLVGCFGMSDVYTLKRAGDSTPPCGTPVLRICFLDVAVLKSV